MHNAVMVYSVLKFLAEFFKQNGWSVVC